MQPASLDEAERHVAVGISHIEMQEQIVAGKDSQGRDSAAAREIAYGVPPTAAPIRCAPRPHYRKAKAVGRLQLASSS